MSLGWRYFSQCKEILASHVSERHFSASLLDYKLLCVERKSASSLGKQACFFSDTQADAKLKQRIHEEYRVTSAAEKRDHALLRSCDYA